MVTGYEHGRSVAERPRSGLLALDGYRVRRVGGDTFHRHFGVGRDFRQLCSHLRRYLDLRSLPICLADGFASGAGRANGSIVRESFQFTALAEELHA